MTSHSIPLIFKKILKPSIWNDLINQIILKCIFNLGVNIIIDKCEKNRRNSKYFLHQNSKLYIP